MDGPQFSEGIKKVHQDIASGMLTWEVYLELWPTEKVVDILNKRIDFFMPVRRALLDSTISSFGKVLDKNQRTWSLTNLLIQAEKDHSALVPCLEESKIRNFRRTLSMDQTIVDKIKTLRDQHVAHHDMNPLVKDNPTIGEITEFINLLEKVANEISYAHNRSRYLFQQVRNKAKNQTQEILQILRKYDVAIQAQLDYEEID